LIIKIHSIEPMSKKPIYDAEWKYEVAKRIHETVDEFRYRWKVQHEEEPEKEGDQWLNEK